MWLFGYSKWNTSEKLLSWCRCCFVSLCWCGLWSGICSSYSIETGLLDQQVVPYFQDSMLTWRCLIAIKEVQYVMHKQLGGTLYSTVPNYTVWFMLSLAHQNKCSLFCVCNLVEPRFVWHLGLLVLAGLVTICYQWSLLIKVVSCRWQVHILSMSKKLLLRQWVLL